VSGGKNRAGIARQYPAQRRLEPPVCASNRVERQEDGWAGHARHPPGAGQKALGSRFSVRGSRSVHEPKPVQPAGLGHARRWGVDRRAQASAELPPALCLGQWLGAGERGTLRRFRFREIPPAWRAGGGVVGLAGVIHIAQYPVPRPPRIRGTKRAWI